MRHCTQRVGHGAATVTTLATQGLQLALKLQRRTLYAFRGRLSAGVLQQHRSRRCSVLLQRLHRRLQTGMLVADDGGETAVPRLAQVVSAVCSRERGLKHIPRCLREERWDAAQSHLRRAVSARRPGDAPECAGYICRLEVVQQRRQLLLAVTRWNVVQQVLHALVDLGDGQECQGVDAGAERSDFLVRTVGLHKAQFLNFAPGALAQMKKAPAHGHVVAECRSHGVDSGAFKVRDDGGRVGADTDGFARLQHRLQQPFVGLL